MTDLIFFHDKIEFISPKTKTSGIKRKMRLKDNHKKQLVNRKDKNGNRIVYNYIKKTNRSLESISVSDYKQLSHMDKLSYTACCEKILPLKDKKVSMTFKGN